MTDPIVCVLCEEPILPEESRRPIERLTGGPGVLHRECGLRMVLGGIGHLENHSLWCIERGDPDGGRSYRQSAIEVDRWVHRNGSLDINAAYGHRVEDDPDPVLS